jgi:hypothetical protein
MIKHVMAKRDLRDTDAAKADLAYWLNRPPEERVAAVDHLWVQQHGCEERLQRSARAVQRARG